MKKVYVSPSPVVTDFSASAGVTIISIAPLYDLVDDDVTVDTVNKTYNMISKLFTLSYSGSTMVAPFIFNGDSQYVKRILGGSVSINKMVSGDSGESSVTLFDSNQEKITVTATFTNSEFLLDISQPQSEIVHVELKDGSRNDTFIDNGVDGYISGTVTGVIRATRTVGLTFEESEKSFSISVQGTGSVDITAGMEMPYILDGCKNSQVVIFPVQNGPVTTPTSVNVTITINNSLNTSTDFE